MSQFEDFVTLELPQRAVMLTSTGTGYTGDPNLSSVPKINLAPAGTWYFNVTSEELWQKKIQNDPASWVARGGGTGGGHTIQDEGVDLTQRTNLNFVGFGVTVTDDEGNDATKVTVAGGHAIQEDGSPLTQRANLNFGEGLTASDDGGNLATKVDLQTLDPSPAGTYYKHIVTVDAKGRVTTVNPYPVHPTSNISRRVTPDASDLAVFDFEEGLYQTTLINSGTDPDPFKNLAVWKVAGESYFPTPGVPGLFDDGFGVVTSGGAISSQSKWQFSSFTISAWVLFRSLPTTSDYRYLFCKSRNYLTWAGADDVTIGFATMNNVDTRFKVRTAGYPTGVTAILDTRLFTTNVWHHIVMRYDGSLTYPQLVVFLNGKVKGSNNGLEADTIDWGNGGEWNLGSPANEILTTGYDGFDGYVDDLRIANVVRSNDYIASMYQHGSGKYPFELGSFGDSGDSVIDTIRAGSLASHANSTPLVVSQFQMNPLEYDTYGAALLAVFRAAASNGAEGKTTYVQLYNVTDVESVATLSFTSTTPEIKEATLTIGTAAGNLKTTPKVYEVRIWVSNPQSLLDSINFGSAEIRMINIVD